MKKLIYLSLSIISIAAFSCNKAKQDTTVVDETIVLQDFVQKIALPQYQNLNANATDLYNSVLQLNNNMTDSNLEVAKLAWRNTRQSWEQCEGFLFGPIEDDNYDPNMDTWPVDYVQLDSLMASNNPLQYADIQLVTLSLRGFHPLEYILWGKNGNAHAADITARKKQYMVSLAEDILSNTAKLKDSWSSTVNFQNEILLAGKGSSRYKTRQEVFMAITGALVDICGEVGSGKISEPFVARDSSITESPFSHNSITDFRNNIIGAQNVYLCSFKTQGVSLSNLVASKNVSLDNQIKTKFATAINSLNSVSVTFEQAIYLQPTQLQNCITALADLEDILDGQLKPFITKYIKD